MYLALYQVLCKPTWSAFRIKLFQDTSAPPLVTWHFMGPALTRPLWECCLIAHRISKISYLPLSVVPWIKSVTLSYPNLIWLDVLGGYLQRLIVQQLNLQILFTENGINPLLSSETYAFRTHGAGITLDIVVLLIWDQLLYMFGTVLHRDSHSWKIKYCRPDLTYFT